MTTTYIKTPVSDPPNGGGEYDTTDGLRYYYPAEYETPMRMNWEGSFWATPGHNLIGPPKWVWTAVPAEAISLEEIWHDHNESVPDMNAAAMLDGANIMRKEQFLKAAELYHNQNSAALKEEIKTLRDTIDSWKKQFDSLTHIYTEQEQQVKTLREALESILISVPDLITLPHGANQYKRFELAINKSKEALSSINQ